jgi:hypothetical protein
MYLTGGKFKVVTDSTAAKHILKLSNEKGEGRLM